MSIAQENRIKTLEAQLQELRTRESISWVGQRLGQALAAQLASTPYRSWQHNHKQTLHAVCGDAAAALHLYIGQLPKE